MKSNYLNWFLLLVFSIGIIGSGHLVYNEIKTANVCPILIGIPACYIILACFVIPFLTHVSKRKNFIYFIFTGSAFIIALVASIMQYTGLGECPKTGNGTPMCYYSLLLFTTLIFLKIVIMKNSKTINITASN